MTSMATQEALPTGLTITTAEAARLLRVSRARLAEFIFSSQLKPVNSGQLLRDEVLALAEARTPPGGYRARSIRLPEGRLDRVPDKVVWLLHDWGGGGTNLDLQVALLMSGPALISALNKLRDAGLVERRADGWHLTAAGWDYTRRFEPPV